MIRSPLWNKHLVDLVVYAGFFVVLPAKMSVVNIHEGFWKVEMLWNKFVVRLDFIDCVYVEGNLKGNWHSFVTFLVLEEVSGCRERLNSGEVHGGVHSSGESIAHLEAFIAVQLSLVLLRTR